MARRVRRGVASPARGGAQECRAETLERIPSRAGLPREQVLEIQRSRLLAGALVAVRQQGYAAVMVGSITQQAKVSRRTFYELFKNREECLAAMVTDILRAIEAELAQAQLDGLAWRER